MNKPDYYNTPEYEAFLLLASYLDHNEEMKTIRSTYRKKMKFYFRKAKRNNEIKDTLIKKINTLSHGDKSISYFQECIATFRMHYIEGKSVTKILTWYREKKNGVDLYESEIHRRIDYIVDLLMIEYLGLDGIFPGITDHLDNSLELNKNSYES